MSEAKRDLALALLQSADEAWSVAYDWVKGKIYPDGEPEENQGPSTWEQLEDLRTRIGLVSLAWDSHQKQHRERDYATKPMMDAVWQELRILQHRTDVEQQKPPTLIEKLEIQKLQQSMAKQEFYLISLMNWRKTVQENFCTSDAIVALIRRIETLERKEKERGIASSGAHAKQLGVQGDDNVQSVRVWCQTSGTGCSDPRNWITAGDDSATCQAGPDPSVEVGGPAAVQPGSGEHVPAADGGKQPAGSGS